MRRPVKPFVTEYRGGTRRQAAGGQALKPDFSQIETEQPGEPRPSASARHVDAQEDSYEAAMRAADALFSARAPARDTAESEAPGEASASHPSGGRVLRVLDEPPSPEMLRLEAERAPKRRGRKPGSKNKPKTLPPLAAQEALEAWSAQDDAAPPVPVSATPAAVVPIRISALALSAARAAVAPRTGDRYAWVRTKLKPGQQWKRRLPKVAW